MTDVLLGLILLVLLYPYVDRAHRRTLKTNLKITVKKVVTWFR